MTVKPKKSWPNGRFSAAGTLTSASKVAFETILWLVIGGQFLLHLMNIQYLPGLDDLATFGDWLHSLGTDALTLRLPPG